MATCASLHQAKSWISSLLSPLAVNPTAWISSWRAPIFLVIGEGPSKRLPNAPPFRHTRVFVVGRTGENAIAGFSFAGLMFPGGEMPVRIFAGLIFACGRLPVKVCR